MTAIASASWTDLYPLTDPTKSSSTGRTNLRPGEKPDKPEVDKVELSKEALAKVNGQTAEPANGLGGENGENGLTDGQQEEIKKMKSRDQEVRAHEQAHIMAGGSLVRGGAAYQLKTGPDGQRYAVGGEVKIDTSPVDGDPRATMRKAQQIQRAARAPADPSAQDRAVAAGAAAMEMKAMHELSQQGTSGKKTSSVSHSLKV